MFKDVIDENDSVKPYEMVLSRIYKDEVVLIPFREVVKNVLEMYIEKYGFSYNQNADDYLFWSRNNHVLTVSSCQRILKNAAEAVNIEKNIGGESLRKTYGVNVYQTAADKLEALVFLEYIFGRDRFTHIINYLGLLESEPRMKLFLGEKFSLCNIDYEKLKTIISENT